MPERGRNVYLKYHGYRQYCYIVTPPKLQQLEISIDIIRHTFLLNSNTIPNLHKSWMFHCHTQHPGLDRHTFWARA